MTLFVAQAATAQNVTTNYTTTTADTKKIFNLADSTLDAAPSGAGDQPHFYVAVDMTPSASGSFTFGQTPGDESNILLVYKDSFDPTQPEKNIFAYGDPFFDTTCPAGDVNSRCLTVTKNLTAGTKYIVVMTAYFQGANLTTPFTLTARGPGAVTFGSGTTAPAAPTNLVATAGNGQVSVAFTAPADGGSAITGYEYQVGTGTWTNAGVTASPVVVTGLTNGTAVGIKLRAKNAIGTGAESASVTATPKASLVLDAPLNLAADVNYGKVVLTFSTTTAAYSATWNYEYQQDDGAWVRSTNGYNKSITVTGLTDGQSYRFKVRGLDQSGIPGPASAEITATPGAPVSKVKAAPMDLVTAPLHGKLGLNFNITSADYDVTYDYEYQLDNGAWVKAGTYKVPFMISGLTDGQTYSIKVRGLDNNGVAGPESVAVTGTPGAPTSQVKTAPQNFEAYPESGAARIFVRVDGSTPDSATTYSRQYQLDGGAWTNGGTSTKFTINGLTNGQTYSVKIRGVDAFGTPGPESAAVTVTPGSTPISVIKNAPTDLVAVPSDGTATLSFQLDDWDIKNTYDFEYQLNDGGAWVKVGDYKIPFTISGLQNGQTYNIKVRAVDQYLVAGPASAAVSVTVNPQDNPMKTTQYTTDQGAVTSTVGMFDRYLYIRPTGAGTNTYNYYAVKMTPEASGYYKFGQKSGSIDTVMIVYKGDFDPNHPERNVIAFNDDGYVAADLCPGANQCPVAYVNLTADEPVTLVMTTYSSNNDLPLPMSFFATGPDAVTFEAAPVLTVPDAPSDLVATAGDGQIELDYTAPANDGGSAITGYKYQLNGAGDWVSAGMNNPITVTGLDNGTEYSIALRAVNAIGDGAVSVPATATPVVTTNYTTGATDVTQTFGLADDSLRNNAPTGAGTNIYSYVAVTMTPSATGKYTFGRTESSSAQALTVYQGSFDPTKPEENIFAFDAASNESALCTSYADFGGPCAMISDATLTAGTTYILVNTSADPGETDTNFPLTAVGPAAVTFGSVAPFATVPDAPVNLVATAGNGQISVAFEAPASDGGSVITAYKYQLGTGDWVSAGMNNPIVITGLDNGTEYSVKLRAVNAVGDGAESVAVKGTPVTTPDAPTNLVATAGDAQVSVAFTAPVKNGGSAITDYEYRLDGGDWVSTGKTSSPIVITGLTNGTQYKIKLRAVTVVGAGTESSETQETPFTTADAPTALKATPGNRQLTVEFTAPAKTGGKPITDYAFQNGEGSWIGAGTTSSPVVITGLTNGTEYSIKLRAKTDAGWGAVSDVVKGTPVTTADAPLNLVATAGNGQISVAFTAPTNTGGVAITGYKYQIDSGDWQNAGTTSSPIVITGLKNGTTYSVKLRAVTTVGDGAASDATTAIPVTTPDAPTALVATRGDGQVSVAFTAAADGGSAITDYEYQLDGGNWVSAGVKATPVLIKSLTNGTTYKIKLRAVNAVGKGADSGEVTAKPAKIAEAPTSLVATRGNAQISVAFTAPNDGGEAIADYEYQLDGGDWISAGVKASPVLINGLTNGTTYSVTLRAVNAVGNGTKSVTVTGKPATTAIAPTNLVATPGVGQISVAFTAPDNGGEPITDYKYQLNGGDWVSAGSTSNPIVIAGLSNGTTYSIKLRAVNMVGDGAESAAVTADTPSPAAEFQKEEQVISEVVVEEASRTLHSTLTFNEQMTRDARQRFINQQRQAAAPNDGSGSNPVPANDTIAFDVDGMVEANGLTLSTRGKFFGQEGTTEARRLVFGDFDLQHDGATGSTTLSFTGRMAWEKMTSADTMLGYFIGGELGQSNIKGSFAGDQRRFGVVVGAYGAHSLSDKLFVDGYVSYGIGRNNLNLSNGILALDSEYETRTTTFGGRLSGIIEKSGYEIWPEFSFNYGRTTIGDLGFTGKAFGLVDSTLGLDADAVTTSTVMFRPEFRLPLDGAAASKSLKILTLAPRIICEQVQAKTTEHNCGGGAEIGISARSEDGMTNVNAKILADRIGNRTQSNLQVNLEFRF